MSHFGGVRSVHMEIRRLGLALCCVALLIGCSDKTKPSGKKVSEDKPAPTQSASGSSSGPTDGPDAKRATPVSQAKKGQSRNLPAPPGGMVWAVGTVNNLGGQQRGLRDDVTDVCVYQQGDIPCTKTEQRGAFRIQVPKQSQVALVFRGDGLTPTIRAFLTTDVTVELGNTRVANEVGVSSVAKELGKPYDPKKGVVFFSGIPGVQVKLLDSSGTRFFMGRTGSLLPNDTVVPMHGSGVYYNIKPTMLRMKFQYAHGTCGFRKDNGLSGWPDPSAPDVARVPIVAGHHTHLVTMLCEPNSENSEPSSSKPNSEPSSKPSSSKPNSKPNSKPSSKGTTAPPR